MHCDNCDSTNEDTLFISKAFLLLFFLKNVALKVGIRGHLTESYWRLSTLFRPPWFTAKRMSRLSSWFTWSTLNVEARGECLLQIKYLIIHLGESNDRIYNNTGEGMVADHRNCEG